MLYYDSEGQRQLLSERAEELARELRRTRRLRPATLSHPGPSGLASRILALAGRPRRGERQRAAAYEA